MIITIGGLAGSGTTTAAKVLSEKLDIPFVSAGDIFRQMAKESKMSILEFSDFAEDNTEIDIEIDKRQFQLAKEYKDISKDLILEGRLSAHFVDADLKVWLIAPMEVRSQRVCDRESKTLKEAIEEINIREKSEALRYLDIHNIDINNMDVYDLIINTNSFSPVSISEIILTSLKVI
ncbi:MAG: AAA family ATPase [Methanobrevibacter sp.]|jgi:cytidylate kinase|nr:AAA family ATPase [Candidatus Methanoflexus mossambicus]